MRTAFAVSPPTNAATSLGRTGMIIPTASMSRTTVMKMKTNAARRADFGGGSRVDVTRGINQWRGPVASLRRGEVSGARDEIRSPKSETNPKFESRMFESAGGSPRMAQRRIEVGQVFIGLWSLVIRRMGFLGLERRFFPGHVGEKGSRIRLS